MKVQLLLVFLAVSGLAATSPAQTKLTIETPETMGMSMFRGHWDTPIPLAADGATTFYDGVPKDKRSRGAYAVWTKEKRGEKPGALAFDALNRSLLVRFPDATEKIAAELAKGEKITKVELVLPFKDEELFACGIPDRPGPDAYNIRTNWGIDDLYFKERPTWHAVAYALRRPWVADENRGPTFNAAVNGKVYWTKYGAQDEKSDRFPARFGPAEVSYRKTETLDITASVLEPSYGTTLGARLRRLSDCGFLVRKLESYDHRYFRGVYEFATATGGRAVLIDTPKLEVTFAPGSQPVGPVPAAFSLEKLPFTPQGKPTAFLPSEEQVNKWAAQVAVKPDWMTAAQWAHTHQLFKMGGQVDDREPLWVMFIPPHLLSRFRQEKWENGVKKYGGYATPMDVYTTWVDDLIARQTRGWSGFETASEFAEWQAGKDIWPGPARDAVLRYWTDWLMPDRPTAPVSKFYDTSLTDGSLIHPMADQLKKGSNTGAVIDGDSYWKATGDWRGNKSFFRSGFTYVQSTQNFNPTSSTGALLFGNLINAPNAIADGKNGVDKWLLKGWIWNDGTGQEFIDHYYYAVTLKGLKALQNGAPDAATRLLGDSLVTKATDEAILAWHPNLKRFIAPASRTSLNYLLATQDGLQFLMHVLSQRGALTDSGQSTVGGYNVLGHEAPPQLIALLSSRVPWVSQDLAKLVDEKPLPWEVTTSNNGSWRRTYLGKNYGLGSALNQSGRIQAMAQWRREDKEVTSARDLGTLDARLGINETRFANDAAGWIGQPGKQVVAQDKNRWLIVGSPQTWNGGIGDGKTPVTSVQASIGLFDIHSREPGGKPSWDIYLDGQKRETLPIQAKQGQSIVIKDGVTFIGITALPSPNLGRDAEVTLEAGKEQTFSANGITDVFQPSLVINSYISKSTTPFPKEGTDWYGLDAAYAGFGVQISDSSEEDFSAFLKRMAAAKATSEWDGTKRQVTAHFQVGAENLAVQLVTAPEKKADGSWKSDSSLELVNCTANGQPLYPTDGTLLDSPLEKAGWDKIEKNGSALTTSRLPGHGARLFLQTTADGKRYTAWNPQGVPADLQWSLPGGLQLRSDGLLGLARFTADLERKTLVLDHYFTDGRDYGHTGQTSNSASSLLLSGFGEEWKITLNGQPYNAHLARATIGSTPWRVLPLITEPRSKEEMAAMLSRLDQGPEPAKVAVNVAAPVR